MQYYSYLQTELIKFIPEFISGILSVIPFIILLVISKSILKALINSSKDHAKNNAIIFVGKSLNLIIWIMALLTMLGTWGLDIRALIAGLGLTGFAVGFALKDVMANAIAGIMVIFFKPFEINSKVSLAGVKGTVIAIDLRCTTVEDEESVHLIPNAKILSEILTLMK
ncbi:MAG: mechanosensitive ion channel [Rickettsiaceae bacterium]